MNDQQWLRKVQLLVSGTNDHALDLSQMRVTFKITKKSSNEPNTAQVRVYNLTEDTMAQVRKESTRVTLQAGYEGSFGVIFDGQIIQSRSVREGVNTYLEILAGDGDVAHSYALVNTTLAAGSTLDDHAAAASGAMGEHGVQPGYKSELGGNPLPRGKVMFGAARRHMRKATKSGGASYSVQDMRLQIVPLSGVAPGEGYVLNSQTGLIGSPTQTPDGIKGKCLINPRLKIDTRVLINERDVSSATLEAPKPGKESDNRKPAAIMSDGAYRLLAVDYSGDTHGADWFCEFTALGIDETLPPKQQVRTK